MRKSLLAAVFIASSSVLLTGCLVAPVQPPMGIVYTDYKAPLDYDQESTPAGTRSGVSETQSILGLVAWGDGSVQSAVQNGNISTIHGADYEYFNIIGVYQRYRTIIHGE